MPTLNRVTTNVSASLEELARKLVSSGPHKVEVTPRRVRAQFDGVFLFDTTSARHVWEHQYYPQFWVPVTAFAPGVLTKGKAVDADGSAFMGTAKGSTKSTDRVLIFEKGPLDGLVRLEFKAAGRFFHGSELSVLILFWLSIYWCVVFECKLTAARCVV